MTEANLAVNFFVALFALIDPIGNVPLTFMSEYTRFENRTDDEVDFGAAGDL